MIALIYLTIWIIKVESAENSETERGRLARAGLSLADQMLRRVLQQKRQRVFLDLGRAIKLFVVKTLQNIFVSVVHANAKGQTKQLDDCCKESSLIVYCLRDMVYTCFLIQRAKKTNNESTYKFSSSKLMIE